MIIVDSALQLAAAGQALLAGVGDGARDRLLARPWPWVLSTKAPSGEEQPVVRHEPPFCGRTSKKFALIAMVG